jgi:hypothetical protein
MRAAVIERPGEPIHVEELRPEFAFEAIGLPATIEPAIDSLPAGGTAVPTSHATRSSTSPSACRSTP